MKIKKCVVLLYTLHLTLYTVVYGAFEQMVNTSVRAQGMGGAFSAISSDADSWQINPAGLGQLYLPNIGLSHSVLYPGLVNDNIAMDFLGFAYPLYLKPSWNYPIVFGLTSANLSSAKYTENMYIISLARQLFLEELYFGMNYKSFIWNSGQTIYFNQQSEDLGKGNSGIDLGVQYGITEEILYGVNLININQPDIGTKVEVKIPMKLKTGICYSPDENFNIAMDMESNVGIEVGNPLLSIGSELWFRERSLALRCGWQTVIDGGNISFGATYRKYINNNQLGFDFAFIQPVRMKELPVYRLAMLFWFGEGEKEEETIEKTEKKIPFFEEKKAEKPVEVVPSLEKGKAKINEIVEMIKAGKLEEVKFKPETTEIIRGYETLDKIGEILTEYPGLKIKIEAYAAPIGDSKVNLEISDRQAVKVRDYIVEKFKIAAVRMVPVGHGGSRAIYTIEEQMTVQGPPGEDGKPTTTMQVRTIPENIEKNRRIEFSIIEE